MTGVLADLPFRIQSEPGAERLVTVDGAFGAPGLNLSHWPGNATPPELLHELSTGIALRFAALEETRRRALSEGCVAIANNHYDTDGVCALAALRVPGVRGREEALLDAAAAGDFFRLPSEAAFVVDAIVTGLADPETSPWRERFAGLDDRARHERCSVDAADALPALLAGEVEPFRTLWEAPLERLRADRAALARAARDELVHLDLALWTRDARASAFDPGRHALFGATDADRVLAIGTSAPGTTYRFVVGTLSWFDLPSRSRQARPDLETLAAELNALEGTRADDDVAWRAQPTTGASPELWFGTAGHERFAEHAGTVLRPSALAPERVKAALIDALRASWTFPDEALTP